MANDNVTLERLENQINWHEAKAAFNQRRFKTLKAASIIAATSIPVLAAMPEMIPHWALGALGAFVAALESFQQLHQYHSNWMSYRATCEALQRERFLYLARAGEYASTTAPAPEVLLAERVEALIAQETVKWAATQLQNKSSSAAPGANAKPANAPG